MNCLHDQAVLDSDTLNSKRVFRFNSRPTLAIRIVESNRYQAQCWLLETDKEWQSWLETCSESDRGLVLILASRADERSIGVGHEFPMSIGDWLNEADLEKTPALGMRHAATFAPFNKNYNRQSGSNEPVKKTWSIRDLPFHQTTFKHICRRFQLHESFLRAVSRADVPHFWCEDVDMLHPTTVYNLRTPNSWDSDLALSATHLRSQGLTYSILLGCSAATEKQILGRLETIKDAAAHPLLVPGICVELELARHTRLVEAHVTDVETYILELDLQYREKPNGIQRKEAKRTAWLNLNYLKNSIITWNQQIDRLSDHASRLAANYSEPMQPDGQCSTTRRCCKFACAGREHKHSCRDNVTLCCFDSQNDMEAARAQKVDIGYGGHLKLMYSLSQKLHNRLGCIHAENDEKIRDCSMRVDGMAMATQWSHSETAVEIALATRNDSQVMRSISLVTMVFLPGTFFATVFSMTFFDWHDESGGARVSSYLWIYVVVTVFFTTVTIGLWYYCVIHRRGCRRQGDVETLAEK